MVADIAHEPVGVAAYFDYYLMYPVDGVAYFATDDGTHGRELWRTDGSATGTWLVKDICPGACHGAPHAFTVSPTGVYFVANDGEHGAELWHSDGTEAGTSLVIDLRTGLQEPSYVDFMAFGDDLFFVIASPLQECSLYRTDGTLAGTTLVFSPTPGADSCPSLMAVVGSLLFFSSGDSTTGRELWTTDGSPAGTAILKDIFPGQEGGLQMDQWRPRGSFYAASFNGDLFFSARSSGNDWEVWRSDGTAIGTDRVLDIEPGVGGSYPFFYTVSGDTLYFTASTLASGSELWKSDGTAGGTQIVSEIAAGTESSNPGLLRDVGGTLFFRASIAATGAELWKTDGTQLGTTLVRDINPGPDGAFSNLFFLGAAAVGSRLFFFADDGVHGLEPWVSDGTGAGTQLLADVALGSYGSSFGFFFPTEPCALASAAVFLAYSTEVGMEPWSSDGTPAGTDLLQDTDVQPSAFPPWLSFYYGVRGLETHPSSSGGRLFFSALDEVHGVEPWVTDGTAQSTGLLADVYTGIPPSGFPRSSFPGDFSTIGGSTFFRAQTTTGQALWVTNGLPSGTAVLDSTGVGQPEDLAVLGDQLLIGTDSGLWALNPTDYDATALFPANNASYLTPSGNSAYFSTYLGNDNSILVKTNGTPAGTAPFANFEPAGDEIDASGTFYFVADDGAHGPELWKAGSQGPELVKDIRPGSDSGFYAALDFPPRLLPSLAPLGSSVLIRTDDGTHGFELWGSQGTAATTTLLRDIWPGPAPSDPIFLATGPTGVLFSANDGVHGREPWISDGTALGTYLVKDILPGPDGSRPRSGAEVDGVFYFSALDDIHGVELWSTDGTTAGTSLVQDINPGAQPSTPNELTLAGPYLYFTANDGTHGFELWAKTIPSRALKPSVVQVDDTLANANGLWEPGETVKLQPVWENLSISNITAVTATAAGINGASVSDTAASYGTFAPLDLRSCLATGNCYAATLPGPRPSTHWDVTLHETLSTGKAHDWPIHIAGSFDDVGSEDTGYGDIEAFLHANLTAGCSATSYCPQDVVTRAQAALFVSLALAKGDAGLVSFSGSVPGKSAYDCTDNGVSVFSDVDPADPFCRFIHDIASRGITEGCTVDSYCPGNALSRAQLALLLGRSLAEGAIPVSYSGPGGSYDCSPGTPDTHFADVDESHPFCAAAHYLWARGVSGGCGDSTFCPDGAVTRAALAAILVGGFDLRQP
jgi:ELWxxDGT repeat protein